MLVVAEDAGIGYLAAGMETVGNRLQEAIASVACQPVEVWRVGILQERLPPQFFARPVGHPVAENDEMFLRHPIFLPF